MITKKNMISFLVVMCLSSVQSTTFGTNPEAPEMEKQEYKQARARIKALIETFTPGPTNDLKEYEKFADEMQSKWSQGNKEYYARLMLEICGPLSSGAFEDDRRYEVARKYALSALADVNDISVETEIELTGHVVTLTPTRYSSAGKDFEKNRKEDVEVRFHAWKRLKDAIDPNWDPNEVLLSPNGVGAVMGLPSGIAPEGVKDPKLRAEYEAALEKNRKQIERHTEQRRLSDLLQRIPRSAGGEQHIIYLYSCPPFNIEELKECLNRYIDDEKTKARILDAVTKNIENQSKDAPASLK